MTIEVDPLYLRLIDRTRPAYSVDETFMATTIMNLTAEHEPMKDGFGNVHCMVYGDSDTLFSCHMDTANGNSRKTDIRINDNGLIYSGDSTCNIGADDATGIYIMLKMIEYGVPGYYVFHSAEEVGGMGSTWLARQDWFIDYNFERAIAFDRAGDADVITHQAYGRCCSGAFANALAKGINQTYELFDYEPCNTGIYTDTAEYASFIPECTNISVGYRNEHTPNETQSWPHLVRLLKACLSMDWANLPTERDTADDGDADVDDLGELIFTVQQEPELVAQLLQDLGYDKYELEDTLYDYFKAQEAA